MTFRPKFISFDCYGTLTRFRMGELARDMYADRIPAERMDQFIADFSAYRFDEVLGAWQPYEVVLKNAVRRLCRKWKIQYLDHEARKYYDAVPTWGPHDDVPAGLARAAGPARPASSSFLLGASTQSRRRSTVKGRMTLPYSDCL